MKWLEKEKRWEWLRANRALKALSLFLAIAAWYAIRENTRFESWVYDVPITFLHEDGMTVLDRSDETVDVKLRGAREDLANIARDRIAVKVDARALKPGKEQLFALGRSAIAVSIPGLRPVDLRPDSIRVSVDREEEKSVPVKPRIEGELPAGLEIEKIVCVPAAVTIRGPRTRLGEVDSLRTEPIDLDGQLQTFQVRRTILPPTPMMTVRLDPDRVSVEIDIRDASQQRRFDGIPVLPIVGGSTNRVLRFDPPAVAVLLQGRPAELEALESGDIQAFVRCGKLPGPGRYDLPVTVHVADGGRSVKVTTDPATVRVTVDDAPSAEPDGARRERERP